MSKVIEPEVISNYIISKNLLDKNTVDKAYLEFILYNIESQYFFYSLQDNNLLIRNGSILKKLELSNFSYKYKKYNLFSLNNESITWDFNNGIFFSKKHGFYIKYNDNYFYTDKIDNFFITKNSPYLFLLNNNSISIIEKDLNIINSFELKSVCLDYSKKHNKIYSIDGTNNLYILNLRNNSIFEINLFKNLIYLSLLDDEKLSILTDSGEVIFFSLSTSKIIKQIKLKSNLIRNANNSMISDSKYLFLLNGNNLYNIDKSTLEIVIKNKLNSSYDSLILKFDISALNSPLSYSDFLVSKKYIHESNMKKILDDIIGKDKVKKDYIKDTLIDQDLKDLIPSIEGNLKSREKEIQELIEPNSKDIEDLLKESGIDWQGRKMSKEEKEEFIKAIANIKTNDEISKVNSIFVLDWMDKLLES
jgi:hypothetical protein